jgi:hypothetical protein
MYVALEKEASPRPDWWIRHEKLGTLRAQLAAEAAWDRTCYWSQVEHSDDVHRDI